MQQIAKDFNELLARVESAMAKLGIAGEETKLTTLDVQMADPAFWDDPQTAGRVSQEAAVLRKHIESWTSLRDEIKSNCELAAMDDDSLDKDLSESLQVLQTRFNAREFELKLSGPYDRGSATVSIHAGTGGTDAQDWAEMLLRMYLRFAEKEGFAVAVIDRSDGEEAGIKSTTFEVNGRYAFGKLRSEKGVHRLVRLSPFNSDNLRQTSFAMVDVLPQLENPEAVEIDAKDLRIDVFRSGGNGGQSVNTTDSAVRITHLPTGIVVAIQNERSQLQNKEKAMAILKAKLTVLMHEQHKAAIDDLRGAPQVAAWGNQIRSYVLHPYQKVKDHRTNAETSQTADVLDGDLQLFIDAYLEQQITK